MKLWMWYAPGTDEQIEAACKAAEAELSRRGVSIGAAFQATVAANELDESYSGASTPDIEGVEAWYAAEFVAFSHLAESAGEWPVQASLIVCQ